MFAFTYVPFVTASPILHGKSESVILYVPSTTDGSGFSYAPPPPVPTISPIRPATSGCSISSFETLAAPGPGKENVLSIPPKTSSYACGFV